MTQKNTKNVFKTFLSIFSAFSLVLVSIYSFDIRTNAEITALDNCEIIFEDDFNRTDRDIHDDNGWYSVWTGDSAKPSHQITDGKLSLYDYSTGGFSVSERPASEAVLNQRVSVDLMNLGELANYASANIYLRFTQSSNHSSASDTGYKVIVTNEYIAIRCAGTSWNFPALASGGENVTYTHYYGHTYRVECTAVGTNPTKLSATLYDVTAGNVAVATVSGTDSTDYLQTVGTAALGATRNGAGQTTAIYDNFKYEHISDVICNDNFDRDNSETIGNDWVIGSQAVASISSNSLHLSTTTPSSSDRSQTSGAALMRPMSEATLNQVISADFQSVVTGEGTTISGRYANQGGVLIARAQSSTATATNCYRLVFRMDYAGIDSGKAMLLLYGSNSSNNTTTIWADTTTINGVSPNYMSSASKYRLELSVKSISSTQSQLDIKLYGLDLSGNVSNTYISKTLIDSDPNLQKAGTAGVSIYDWSGGAKISVDNFNYTSPIEIDTPNTFSFNQLDSQLAYKNNYEKAYDVTAMGETSAKQSDGNSHIGYEKLGTSLDSNSGYIAYAVTADKAGNYPIKLRYRFGSDSQTDYDSYTASNGNPYAVVVINGQKYSFASSKWGEFCTTNEVYVALNAGVNIIYCMAPTAELADTISGAYIDYDCLFTEKSLTAISGTFVLPCDINGDNEVDLKDLVRMKQYLAGATVAINRFSADLDVATDGTSSLNSADIVKLRQALLKIETQDFSATALSWLRFVDTNVINPLSMVTQEIGGAEQQADELRESIYGSTDRLNVTGTKYYISEDGDDSADGTSPETAWKTLEKLQESRDLLKSGDGVFFERGSVFRQQNTENSGAVMAVSGVSYGAYGEGDKPQICGSAKNYADASWSLYGGNVWQIDLSTPDAGIIVFDSGSNIGVKKFTLDSLSSGNDFYHDTENGILYLYSAIGCPSDVYNSIEIGIDRHMFVLNTSAKNITIDNLDIKYVGAHAISGEGINSFISITNCEFSWVGGSSRSDNIRYGNAIQFWNSCNDITVENCLAEQIYDAALTFQGANGSEYSNISFKNNLIRYSNYSVEFFIRSAEDGTNTGLMNNIDIIGNVMQYAGYGVCEQRPSKEDSAHICGWNTDIGSSVQDFCIQNNIFDLAAYNIVNWTFTPTSGISISNNSYFMKSAISDNAVNYGTASQYNAVNQATLESAIAVFDTSPEIIKWMGK